MFILFKVPTLLTEYECFSPGYDEEQEYEDGNKILTYIRSKFNQCSTN